MTIDTWSPASNTEKESIDKKFLQRCLEIAECDQLNELDLALTDEEKKKSSIMHAKQAIWEETLQSFSDDQLVSLIRFFTIAEMQLNGWQAGNESPVIAINQILKSRGNKLDKAMLMWIRENSSNRFIPNGAVL